MLLGVEHDKLPFLESLFRYPTDASRQSDYLQNYLSWDDQRLSTELLKNEYSGSLAGQMFRRLTERRLFKRVIDLKIRELQAPLPEAVSQRFKDKRTVLEEEAAAKLSELTKMNIPASQVIFHLYKIESVRKQARNDEAGILIKRSRGLVPLEEESVLFKSINESMRDENLDCYAPLPECDEKKRRSIEQQMREWFLSRLNHHFDHQFSLPQEKTP
jgi:HD associated region